MPCGARRRNCASTSRPMGPDVPAASDGRQTVVIGDIHGCLDELQDLLAACSIDWTTDRVISVGDLVAKGPDSQGVVQLARELGIRAVLGNHDAKVLSVGPNAEETEGQSGHRRRHVAVARTLRPADWTYLNDLPLFLALPDLETIVVHAGLVAGVPLSEQSRDLLMNMRSITPTGQPSMKVEGGVPWASVWPGPAHVVFGHDATRGLQQHRFATGVDTGCVYGRKLTALCLPKPRLVSVPARRTYVEP